MISSLRDISGFVFDFDGTIASLTIDFAEMRRRVLFHLQGFGIAPDGLRDLYVLEMIAAGKLEIARKYPGREKHYERQAMEMIRGIEVAAAGHGELFAGIREMFIQLRASGIKCGLVTRNCREAVQQIFPDISGHVTVILTRDDTLLVKPHPEHLLQVLRTFSLPAARTAMVGDHKMDMKLAKDVGALAIGVLTGHDTATELQQAGADLILPQAVALTAIFSDNDPGIP